MKVPILNVTAFAYRDVGRAAIAMPQLSFVALVICLAEALSTDKIQKILTPTWTVELIGMIVTSFLLTPFLIAVHRYILLGEVTMRFRLDVRSRRFQKFFGCSAILLLIWNAPLMGDLILNSRLKIWAVAGWLLIGVVVSLKLALLFPAIAVDSISAQWSGALRGSRGSTGRILIVCILVSIPALALLALIVVFEWSAEEDQVWQTPSVVLSGLVNFVSQFHLVAAASHLFLILGDRMSDRSEAGMPADTQP